MQLRFTKMQGCGNDYIYLDCRAAPPPENVAALTARLSVRHSAIGADGLICIAPAETAGAAATMRIYNADGSEGKMCGNGIRCVAQWLYTHDPACRLDTLRIDTRSGTKTLTRLDEGIWQVAMGRYSTKAALLPAVGLGDGPLVDIPLPVDDKTWRATCVSVGNPHCVVTVPDAAALALSRLGPGFERHPAFPERINTEFTQQLSDTRLRVRVWERGSGETYACGTGACAAAAAMAELGRCPFDADIAVELRGGVLSIRVEKSGEIWMTGPAVTVYEGVAEV